MKVYRFLAFFSALCALMSLVFFIFHQSGFNLVIDAKFGVVSSTVVLEDSRAYFAMHSQMNLISEEWGGRADKIYSLVNIGFFEIFIYDFVQIDPTNSEHFIIGYIKEPGALVLYFHLFVIFIFSCVLYWLFHRKLKKINQSDPDTKNPESVPETPGLKN